MRAYLSLSGAALALSGCSALQIDVDVYKGPLTNEPAIQARQFVTLAIAAKPVLASLRNEMEAAKVKSDPVKNDEFNDKLLKEHPYDFNRSDYKFKNLGAGFLDGVLSFYEDAASSRVSRALVAYNQVKAELNLFDFKRTEDQELAKSLDDAALKATDAAEKNFICAYRNFLSDEVSSAGVCPPPSIGRKDTGPSNPDRRDVGTLSPACKAVFESSRWCAQGPRSNEGFKLLANPDMVGAHSQKLFGKRNEPFITRVTDIAQSFLRGRQAMRDLWLASVDLVEYPEETASLNLKARRAAANLMALSTQPRILACYLTKDKPPVLSPVLRGLLEDHGRSGLLAEQPINWASTNKAQFDAADAALIAAAAAPEPVRQELISLLHRADAWLRFSGEDEIAESELAKCTAMQGDDRNRVSKPEARWYGLSRGPDLDKTFEVLLGHISQELSVLGAANFAWDRGRPVEGLETLHRQFLDSLSKSKQDIESPEAQEAMHKLTESLMLFAERLLFVVNNGRLFDGESSSSYRPKQAVLQTVGNTLVLHANDLKRRETHEALSREAFASELTAAQQAFSGSPEGAFDQLLRELKKQGEKTVAMTKAVAADAKAASEQAKQADDATSVAGESLRQAQKALQDKRDAHASYVAAYLTTVDAGVLIPLPKDDAAQIRLDRADVKALLTNDPNGVGTVANLRQSIVDWISTQLAGPDIAPNHRSQRLRDTLSLLTGEKSPLLDGLPGATHAESAKAFRATIERWASMAVADLKLLEGAVAQAQAKLASAARVGQKTKSRADGQQILSSQAVLSATSKKTVVDVIERERSTLMAYAPRDMESLVARLQKQLEAKARNAPNDEGIQKALLTLKALPPPTAFPFSTSSYGPLADNPGAAMRPATQLAVMDDVLTLLRQQHLNALAAGRPEQAETLQAAINAAYESRTSLLYLRPAADYLKNVYSASALMDDPSSSDPNKNLLISWTDYVIPDKTLVDRWNNKDSDAVKARDAKSSIEKLFWQNINTVRLSGGGSANYVVAKDDVGNWYVKSYSADPESIVKSAQGLALFQAGGRLDVNLLRQRDLERRLDKTTDNEERKQIQTALDHQSGSVGSAQASFAEKARSAYAKRYADGTLKDADDLLAKIDALRKNLEDGWGKDVPTEGTRTLLNDKSQSAFGTELSAPRDDLQRVRTETADGKAEAGALGQQIASGLNALRRFRLRLQSQVLALPDATDRDPALLVLKREVRAGALDIAERRKAAIRQYEDALTLVGEAVTAP